MNQNVYMKIRILTGGIIALHGLLRIIFIERYIDFVFENFFHVLPAENLLTIGAAIIPFVEFFVGLLILTNISLKKSIVFSACLSIMMMVFIVVGDLYQRLIYHSLIILLMAVVYINHPAASVSSRSRRRFT